MKNNDTNTFTKSTQVFLQTSKDTHVSRVLYFLQIVEIIRQNDCRTRYLVLLLSMTLGVFDTIVPELLQYIFAFVLALCRTSQLR